MRFDLDNLPTDPVVLHKMLKDLLQVLGQRDKTIDEQTQTIQDLEHRLALHLRARFGAKSEKLDDEQMRLAFAELARTLSGESPAEPTRPLSKPLPPPRKGHGRKRPAASLPRERIEHALTEAELACSCGSKMEPIGEESSEVLDYKPSSFFVRVNARIKYACKGCQEGVKIAPVPAAVIDKGLPGAGLLSHVITSKYADHLPLTRLEDIFGREGVDVRRSTMGDWMERSASLLSPLVTAMKEEVLQSRKLHTDDTPVPVLDPGKKKTKTGRLWTYVGDEAHPFIVYDYTPSRERDGPLRFLKSFKGYLQGDAYAGYDAIFAKGEIIEVACWAHARRKFFDAKETSPLEGIAALAYIHQLYEFEKEAAHLDDDARQKLRQEKAAPLLTEFASWLDKVATKTLPKSPLGTAIGYAKNQWRALTRYTEHGFLAIDNNPAERALRAIAIGRKNWLFAGSDDGGRTAATLYSLIATCKRHKVDPFVYLRDVLEKISTHPASRALELLPGNWSPPVAVETTASQP